MWKPMTAAALCAAALAACGGKQTQAEPPSCADPAVVQKVQEDVRQWVNEQARRFAGDDRRGFVDADKIAAVAADMAVRVDNPLPAADSPQQCQGQFSIVLPPAALARAQENAPLLYGDVPLLALAEERLAGSQWQLADNGVLNRAVRYTPQYGSDGRLVLTYADNSLPVAANALVSLLLPYGVKDMLVVDGQVVARADALRRLRTGGEVPEMPDPAVAQEEDVLGAFIASQTAAEPAPEVLQPGGSMPQEVPVDAGDLEQARTANRQARDEINAQWERMDKAVQQGLLDEQRAWIDKRDDSCRQAAAQAGSTVQAEYLYLQCGTRMTRERIQYLKGYSIN
ncbi:lysozyme inhibitor LprI family protein [Neisseria leonii]|uniref:Lysozyme inhibitor LprI family protein n=1 Tax=Neisseria leonii TaxID=2995413 RepID=A0A9X4E2I5_9NEIS|nr:lysozyme inhibitor LprI family protein [Neisseria sp. 51.81]MDD9328004.1 lysozyme inhibitor LprI family protein [Neisseria sp. 51.81]